MSSIRLTEQGKQILTNANTEIGATKYWIGFFGLAYVPKREDPGEQDDDSALVNSNEKGDYIYNIWQGDLVGTGYASESMARATLYDRNVMSNFRYVYDGENQCNRLVTWYSAGETSYTRNFYKVYDGVTLGDGNDNDVASESNIPVPAPLFYANLEYGSPMSEQQFAEVMGSDWPKVSGGYPRVTPDMRSYAGGLNPVSAAFNSEVSGEGDYIKPDTFRPDEDNPSLDQYAKFASVSRFNKSHGPVLSEGYAVLGPEHCHNMSRATRLFPLAKYEVTASQPATGENKAGSGIATSIKYRVELDLSGATRAMQEYRGVLNYGDNEFAGKGNSFKFNRVGIYAVQANIRHFYANDGEATQGGCRAGYYQVEILPDVNPVLFAVADLEEVCMSEDSTFGQNSWGMDFVLDLGRAETDSGLCRNTDVYYNLAENEAITWYQNQLLASAGLSEAVTNLQVSMAHMMNRAGESGGSCSSSAGTAQQVAIDGTMYALKAHAHNEFYKSTPQFVTDRYRLDGTGDVVLLLKGSREYWIDSVNSPNTTGTVILSPDGMKDGEEVMVNLPSNPVKFRLFGETASSAGAIGNVTLSGNDKGCWMFRRSSYITDTTDSPYPGFIATPVNLNAFQAAADPTRWQRGG